MALPKRTDRLTLKKRSLMVVERLSHEYPDARCELDFRSPYELFVAVVLSAQCTDKRVNLVTPLLFERIPDFAALSAVPTEELQQIIRPCGFFRMKTKNLKSAALLVNTRFDGRLPQSMAELITLPGVARKTANVLLETGFGIVEGIVVDTHVKRVSGRLKFTENTDPVRIERDLQKLFGRQWWGKIGHLFVWHGRRVCVARKPRCEQCVLADICPSSTVAVTLEKYQ